MRKLAFSLLAAAAVIALVFASFPVYEAAEIAIVEGGARDGDAIEAWEGERIILEADHDKAAGTRYYYRWSMGDGTTDEGSIVAHTYSQAGVYNVTLRIYNETDLLDEGYAIVEVEKEVSISQLLLFTISLLSIPLTILAVLNVIVIVGGRLLRRIWRPGVPYDRWTLRSITMFNLLLITIPVAAVLSPIYIVPAIIGTVIWVVLGTIFTSSAPLFVRAWANPSFARFMKGRLGVVDREVTRYHPVRKNVWSAVKQRSGIALEMMPVPLYGIFIATALMMRYSGGIEEVVSSVWFYTMLAMAPIYTAPIVVLRILKDSNLLAVDAKKVRVQFLGDALDETLQKVGMLGGITALFQITIVLSPSIASAWALMLVIIPTISGLVLAYMFLTAFVYLGFHPRLVKRLNAAMWKSPLPKYDIADEGGTMSIVPLSKDGKKGPERSQASNSDV